MLKACGIVAEYNPFHNGHAYHILETKKKMSSDVVIAIMSGNFVQRGELACVDKWTRTQSALQHGVDIVIELPAVYSVQAADYFAYGAMKIAKQLGVSELSFGVEKQTAFEGLLAQSADTLNINKDFSQSFAKQWQEKNPLLRLPNQQLAFSYMKAAKQLAYDLTFLPIERLGSLHTDSGLPDNQSIASATAIRNGIMTNQDIRPFVDKTIYHALMNQLFDKSQFFNVLKYQLMIQTHETLRSIYQMSEGIEYVLKREVERSTSYDEFISRCVSKRFSQKRLQRLCLYVLFQWTTNQVKQQFEQEQAPIRVLGFSPKGRQYLKQLDKNTYVTQLKKTDVEWFDMTITVDKLYEQLTGVAQQNFKRVVRVNENYTTI